MAPVFKTKGWTLTLRPKDGIQDVDIDKFKRWIKSRRGLNGYLVITEKTGVNRHIHCCLYYKTETSANSIYKYLVPLFKDEWFYRSESLWPIACTRGTSPLYNDSFYSNYLTKDDSTVIIMHKEISKEDRCKCYKDKPGFKSSSDITKRHKPSDWYYDRLECLYKLHYYDKTKTPNYDECCYFLYDMMYNAKLIRVCADLNKFRRQAHALSNYLGNKTFLHFWDGKDYFTGAPLTEFSDLDQQNHYVTGAPCKIRKITPKIAFKSNK